MRKTSKSEAQTSQLTRKLKKDYKSWCDG